MRKWLVLLAAIFIIVLCSGGFPCHWTPTWWKLFVLPLLFFLVILIFGSWMIGFLGQVIRRAGLKKLKGEKQPDIHNGRGEHIPRDNPEETVNRQKGDSV